MSRSLGSVNGVEVTAFYGGEKRGQMYQLTSSIGPYVQLSLQNIREVADLIGKDEALKAARQPVHHRYNPPKGSSRCEQCGHGDSYYLHNGRTR